MSTTESPSNLNQLHKRWIADPTMHEAEFFKALRKKVSYALRKVYYKPDVDMIADAFVHVYERLDRWKPIGSFSGFVKTIVEGWGIDQLRHEDVVEQAEMLLPTGRRGRQIGKTPAIDDYDRDEGVKGLRNDEQNWSESLFDALRLSEQDTPDVNVSYVEDPQVREVCERILAGRKIKQAAIEAGLTENAARKKLRRLADTYQVVVTISLPRAA